jgi:hypothetical protein
MKINIHFLKQLIEDLKNGNLNSKIDLVNKILRIVIQTSSIFTLLSIFITILNIFFYNFEIQKFKFLYEISITVGYGAFYLLIFAIFPIIGFLTLLYFLNKIYKLEINKINIHFRQLTINITLMIVAIILIVLLNYRLSL